MTREQAKHFAILFMGMALIVLVMSAGVAVGNLLFPVILK